MNHSLYFILATLLFTHISRCAADDSSVCKNDSTFSFTHEGTTRGCGWIRKLSDDIRQDVCQDNDIRSQCKVSCGICCEDDPDYFSVIDGVERYCSWFGKKAIRINTYCGKKFYLNGAQLRNVCPEACGNCPSFISLEKPAPQSAAPALRQNSTPAPTPAPTPIPTPLPGYPTMTPTRAPVLIPDQDAASNPAPQNNLVSVVDGPPDDRNEKVFPYGTVFGSLGGVLCLSLGIAAFVILGRRANPDRKLRLPSFFRRKG